MILVFPDLDTLKLCLTSGVIPAEVSLTPVVAHAGDEGLPWLETQAKLPKGLPERLRKLGVQQARTQPSAGQALDNWLQVLPITRLAGAPEPGPQTPVLFELPDPTHLPMVVGEMLRLSNDRQSFRWLAQDDKPGPVLLRVIGPPYYTLLRALDQDGVAGKTSVRAYVEQAPKVWVEVGYTHPLIHKIIPPKGQQLLLQAPRRWSYVTEAPFRDIYEILDFKLPNTRLDWDAADLKHRLRVPLRLIEGDAHEPDLWVLNDKADEQLDTLVRDAKESLIQRLIFAVGSNGAKNMIVLRVRPSKLAPPQLVLDARAYCTYLKLPNLFLPVGTRLHPVLRRDAIRRLLAEDPGQITWLAPNPEKPGSFTPQTLPDDAFRPLQDWVDYVLDQDRRALESWIQEFRFDFRPFVCVEEQAPERPRPPGTGRRRAPSSSMDGTTVDVRSAPVTPEMPKPQDEFEVVEVELADLETLPPAQLQLEIAELEKKFVALDGTMDSPERLQLWGELAWRYAATKAPADATTCWLNRLWEVAATDAEACREWIRKWLQIEKPLFAGSFSDFFERCEQSETPAPSEVRAVVAAILAGAYRNPPAATILAKLPQLQQFLEQHERMIGIRAAWLGHLALASLANHDALGLARVRDRLLERLFADGLSPERDLPHFLRTAGHQDSERLRVVQAHARNLYDAACAWLTDVAELSQPFVDLIFAFGFARLGEGHLSQDLADKAMKAFAGIKVQLAEHAKALLRRAKTDQEQLRAEQVTKLAVDVPAVHQFLAKAFQYRIDQAKQGKSTKAPLPNTFRVEIDKAFPIGSFPRYGIDRMLKLAMILEPQEEFDPYRNFNVKSVGVLHQELLKLANIHDPNQLGRTIEHLLKRGVNGMPTALDRLSILCDSLAVAPRVGEAFTLQLLQQVPDVLNALPSTPATQDLTRGAAKDAEKTNRALIDEKTRLLQRALMLAANYDRAEQVQSLFQTFLRLLHGEHGRSLHQVVALVVGECIRSLRKLGLRDEVSTLLNVLGSRLLGGKSIAEVKADSANWPESLRALLLLSSGWLNHGQVERALPILDEARAYLFGANGTQSNISVLEHWNVACTYVTVLGQAPIQLALQRIVEVLHKIPAYPNGRTSAPFYAELHVKLVESVVLAVVSEDFALGPSARRWLDEDEYLIRRRIHADHLRMKESAGM